MTGRSYRLQNNCRLLFLGKKMQWVRTSIVYAVIGTRDDWLNTLCIIHTNAGSAFRLMITPTTPLSQPIIILFDAALPDIYAAN